MVRVARDFKCRRDPNDPFLKLLHRSAERLAVIPAQDRTPWANRAVAMARLLQLSQKRI